MAERAAAPPQQAVRRPGRLASLITLPFRLFGALCGSLLLSVLVEWVGMHFFWPAQGWHHAQAMLYHELDQISAQFTHSLLLSHPAQVSRQLITSLYGKLFRERALPAWIERPAAHPLLATPHFAGIDHAVRVAYAHLKPYTLAAGYTVLTFLARLLVLTLTLPLFVLAAFVALVDGLVRRDLRRFGAGPESGFLYHRARATLAPAAMLPWVVYLALPVSVPALVILLPAAALLALLVNITAATFKKYL